MEKFTLGSFYASGVNIRVEHAQGEKAVLGVTSDYCRAILTAGREGAITSKTASELHIEAWERNENTVVSSPREWLDAACETAILPYNVLGDLDLDHPCAFEGFVPDSTFIDQLDCELRDLYYPDHTLYDLAGYSCFVALLRRRPRSFTADELDGMSRVPRPLSETDDQPTELVFGFQGSSPHLDDIEQTTVLMRQHLFKPEASRLFVCAYSDAREDYSDYLDDEDWDGEPYYDYDESDEDEDSDEDKKDDFHCDKGEDYSHSLYTEGV